MAVHPFLRLQTCVSQPDQAHTLRFNTTLETVHVAQPPISPLMEKGTKLEDSRQDTLCRLQFPLVLTRGTAANCTLVLAVESCKYYTG